MCTQVIYHDFKKNHRSQSPAPTVVLNQRVLKKGKRHFKTIETINALLKAISYFLCGACAGFSIFVLLLLCVWF